MFWEIYTYIAGLTLFTQAVFIIQAFNNYRYAKNEILKKRKTNGPKTLLTVPCKGTEPTFEKNIRSFFELDYENYILCFVVQETDDPAYLKLCKLKNELESASKALEVRVLVAGLASGCSQKIHNLLYSCSNAPRDVEIFAFADSDACMKPEWLSRLVYPLRKTKRGATTGYRWFVPTHNNLASLALSAINAKVAQLLGNTHFNQAWGGSMAIRKETFFSTGLNKIWQGAISDDLCLSWAVKKAGLKVVFVPGCLVASHEKTDWPRLFEFARRQFIITRITTPGTWWFGFLSSIYAVAGVWLGLGIAAWAAVEGQKFTWLYALVPLLFLAGQLYRAILRQNMIKRILPEEIDSCRTAAFADIAGNLAWSWLMLVLIASSALGRKITWRGITYRIKSPTETEIITDKTA